MSSPSPEMSLAQARFELKHELGQGGFGVVWEAWDKRHEQRVAVKLLHRQDDSALRRFKGEFRTLANLAHENLVSLYELHQDERRWFFTMELVDGTMFNDWVAPNRQTLLRAPSVAMTKPARPKAISDAQKRSESGGSESPHAARDVRPAAFANTTPGEAQAQARAQHLTHTTPDPILAVSPVGHVSPLMSPWSGPKPFHGIEVPDDITFEQWDQTRAHAAADIPPEADYRRLRAAFRQLVEALSWLHGSGHLHRDVKPSNVLVTASGQVKVLDFGLVTRLWDHELSANESIIGTPVYMAPELCAGLTASPASDWYSVGVMLYTVLTNRLPFSGDLPLVVLAKQALEPRPPSELVPGIPADLEQLCMALLAKNPVERPDAQTLLEAFGAPPRTLEGVGRAAQPGVAPAFVGRTQEVQFLSQALALPRPAVVMIEGLSGVGKTSLLEHILREAEQRGDHVLRSRCFERGSVAYKALDGAVDDLSRRLSELSNAEIDALLPTDRFDRAALARVFPVIPRLCADEAHEALDATDPQEVKRRAFKALRQLFHASADGAKMIISIDDAQWADDDSLAPLAELLRPMVGAASGGTTPAPAITWLVAYRSDEKEQSTFLQSFVRTILPLVPSGSQKQLAIGPLPPEEAARLAIERLGSDAPAMAERARAIAVEAKGHPLLIDEMARASVTVEGVADVPSSSLTTLLMARLAALPPSARAIVELVAIAGEPVETTLIRAATNAVQRDLNLLISERLLRMRQSGRGETMVTWHDRVRETATAGVDAPTLAARHRTLAETAERVATPEALADDAFLYLHWRGAGDLPKAETHGLAAAAEAERAFAFDRAADLYQAVLDLGLTKTPELLERLADAKKNAGRGIEAGKAYLDAAALVTEPDKLRRLEIRAAEQFLFAGGLADGRAVIQKVLGRVGLSMSSSMGRLIASMMWQSLRMKVRGMEFEPRAEAETSPEKRAVVDTLWSATIGMSMAHPLTSAMMQKRHLRMALDLGEPLRVTKALSIELAFSGLPGGNDDSLTRALSERAHAVAKTVPHPYADAFITMSDGATNWLRGRWKEAQRCVEHALAVYETSCTGVAWEKDSGRFVSLVTLYHRGELAQLTDRYNVLLADTIQRGDLFAETQIRTRLTPFLMLVGDRPDEVASYCDATLAKWVAHSFQVFHLYAWWAKVEALLYQGKAADAQALWQSGFKPAKRSMIFMSQYYRAQNLHLGGRVALANGDFKAADAAAKQLVKEDMAWTKPLGQMLAGVTAMCRARATGAHVAGAKAFAVGELEAAAQGFVVADMEVHRLAAEHALGHIDPEGCGARGQAASRSAQALGVVRPEPFLGLISGVSSLR